MRFTVVCGIECGSETVDNKGKAKLSNSLCR